MKAFERIREYIFRLQSLENRITELENYIIRENKTKKYKNFLINNVDKKKLSGKWTRIEKFKSFKRARALFSSGNELYAGFDGSKNKGSIKKYINNKWYNINIPAKVDEVSNIIIHNNKIWFSCFSKINGASVWCINDDEAVLVGYWKNYLGSLALCSYKNKLYTSLVPQKKENSGPILCYDGNKWDVLIDKHPFHCIYELKVFKDTIYASTIAEGFWGGHLLSIDIKDKTWKTIGGDGVNNSWHKIAQLLRFTSNEDGLYALGNLSLLNTNSNPNLWGYIDNQWYKSPDLPKKFLNHHSFNAIIFHKNRLIIGCGGRPAGNAKVIVLDNNGWYQIGGGGIFNSWSKPTSIGDRPLNKRMSSSSPCEYVYQFCIHKGDLYAGFGASMGNGQIWKFESE